MFGLSVCEYFRACVRVCVLLAFCLINRWREFHQTLVDGVVEGTVELIGF